MQQEISGVRVVLWQMIVSLPLFAFAGAAFETIRWENLAFAPIAGLLYQGGCDRWVRFHGDLLFIKPLYAERHYKFQLCVSHLGRVAECPLVG